MATRKTVRVGVFIPTECQLLDQACVDVLASMSYEYLQLMANMLPKAVIDLSPSMKIHYIGSVKAGQPIPLTANQQILATNHYSDAEVAPGQLDIVIVPGPDPNTVYESGDEAVEWLRNQGSQKGTDILSVCTGIFICGAAGLLSGRVVCGPRGLQDAVKARYGKDITMKGTELRWIQDGNFWSSGGVTNGNDLMAAYARHKSEFFPKPLVEIGLSLVDVGDRPQKYGESQPAFFLGFGYNIFRAWLMSFWRK